MDIITVNAENIADEHICCAITDKKGENCVASKKAWLTERFQDGLVFRKMDVRGKAFIEYIPAEKAWCPLHADGYMHIDCFWVAGQFAGHGYAGELLASCVADAKAKGMRGLTALSSAKKRSYLSDPQFLTHKGFRVADTAEPYFQLYYLPFAENAPPPAFRECCRRGVTDEPGMVLYYSAQCPFTDKYVPKIAEIAAAHGRKIALHRIASTVEAQNMPAPYTTYAFFYRGAFVTHEIFSEKRFEKFLQEHEE